MSKTIRRGRLAAMLAALGLLAAMALPGLAAAGDKNDDRLPDKWEKRHHLTLKVDQSKRDQDSDGLKNLAEFRHKTDPRDADSDNDGIEDCNDDSPNDDGPNHDADDDNGDDGPNHDIDDDNGDDGPNHDVDDDDVVPSPV